MLNYYRQQPKSKLYFLYRAISSHIDVLNDHFAAIKITWVTLPDLHIFRDAYFKEMMESREKLMMVNQAIIELENETTILINKALSSQ